MSDLTAKEQANVKAALRFLRVRCGGWEPLAKVLRLKSRTLARLENGSRGPVGPILAYRLARLAEVGVDDVLRGAYPPAGTCPHCGHRAEDTAEAAQ